jgi:hypothetical protein
MLVRNRICVTERYIKLQSILSNGSALQNGPYLLHTVYVANRYVLLIIHVINRFILHRVTLQMVRIKKQYMQHWNINIPNHGPPDLT